MECRVYSTHTLHSTYNTLHSTYTTYTPPKSLKLHPHYLHSPHTYNSAVTSPATFQHDNHTTYIPSYITDHLSNLHNTLYTKPTPPTLHPNHLHFTNTTYTPPRVCGWSVGFGWSVGNLCGMSVV